MWVARGACVGRSLIVHRPLGMRGGRDASSEVGKMKGLNGSLGGSRLGMGTGVWD